LALGGLPHNAPKTLEKLTYIADEIWYIAGDRSADVFTSLIVKGLTHD